MELNSSSDVQVCRFHPFQSFGTDPCRMTVAVVVVVVQSGFGVLSSTGFVTVLPSENTPQELYHLFCNCLKLTHGKQQFPLDQSTLFFIESKKYLFNFIFQPPWFGKMGHDQFLKLILS